MTRFVFAAAATLAMLMPAAAWAQYTVPHRLSLGTVHVGGTVEAGFLVGASASDPDNVPFKIEPPRFVKVVKASVGRTYALEGVALDVVIALDTSKAGEFDGEIKVTFGAVSAKVPVSIVVKPADPKSLRLLVAGAPFHPYAMYDGNEFRAWTDLVADARWNVDYLMVAKGGPVFRDLDLGKYGTVLLPAHGLFCLTEADIKRVREFVRQGGHLVMTAGKDSGSVDVANKVLDGSGLKMRDTESTGPSREVIFDREMIAPELAKEGVGSVRFYRASPIGVSDAGKGRVLVKAAWVGEAGDGFVARAPVGEGHVVVLGSSAWWEWISPAEAKDTDNAKLLRYLLMPGQGP